MMLKKMVLLFVLLSGLLLMACAGDDEVEQANYEGESNTWRAELEYQEVTDDGHTNAEIDMVISYNGELGESESADEISYRLELENTIVFENTESYDETEEISALYISGDSVIENPLPNGARIVLEVEWDGQTEEFQLDRIVEE